MKNNFIYQFIDKYFKTQKSKFTFFGASFGLTFPIGAIIIDWLIHDYDFSIPFIVQQNPLHYLIATAPFVLGSLTRLAGIRDDRIKAQTLEIEQINQALSSQNQEMEDIFSNIDQGIITINSDYSINQQYSKFMETIFNRNDIASSNFINFIYPQGPAKDKKDLQEYIDLLFTNKNADESMLRDLNPIRNKEFGLSLTKGEVSIKYLTTDFVRIIIKNKVTKILIIIKDLTEETNREKAHQKERQEYEEELQRISAIIQVTPQDLNKFISDYESISPVIERIFSSSPRNREEKQSQRNNLLEVLSQLHALKGEARLYNLKECAEKIHNLEEICRLQNQDTEPQDSNINKTMEVMLALSEYKIAIESIKETRNKLTEKLNQHIQSNNQGPEFITQEFLPQLHALQQSLSRILTDYEHVSIETKGAEEKKIWISELNLLTRKSVAELEELNIKKKIQPLNIINELSQQEILNLSPIKPAIIQLLQNAIVHGIEPPLERVKNGKSESGKITLSFTKDSNEYTILIADDGQGINAEQIKNKLVQNKKLSQAEADKISAEETVKYIFQSGFSAAESKNQLAGHGLGMDMVKRTVQKMNGRITIRNTPNKGFALTILIPTNSN